MKKNNTQMLVEAGIMLAMAVVLNEFVKLFKMPMGGLLHWEAWFLYYIHSDGAGRKDACRCCLQDTRSDHRVLPGASLVHTPGLSSGIWHAWSCRFLQEPRQGMLGGIVTGIAGRFVMHVISGVAFFANYAIEAGKTPLVYSVSYNPPYLGVEMAIAKYCPC